MKKLNNMSYMLDVKFNDEGEAFIELPDEIIAHLDAKVGDSLEWTDNHDGSWTLTKKKESMLVLVETVSTFRHRYVVEVPAGGNSEWALDSVVMQEASEFSQKHLDETIVSHRVVSEEEALILCDEDNEYASSWSKENKIKAFFSKIEK